VLDVLQIPLSQLFALLAAVGFAAGLNVYATVGVLGLLARFGHMPLPSGLQVLQNRVVIGACIAMFLIEFFADKVPAFDLVWNALQTFVRVPVAAFIGYRAASQLSPEHQLLAALVGAGLAFAAHGGKTAVRAAVTPSPEPVSNITLSLGEDAIAIGLTWLATRHPYVAGTMAVAAVVLTALLLRFVVKALRALFDGESGLARAA